MSDILTSCSSYAFDDRTDNDNLVEFLRKLARFGIDQCLHFAHLVVNKQRSIENLSTHHQQYRFYQHKRIELNDLSMEIQRLQNEFYNILLQISSSDDSTKQLLFIKLQNNLSNFVDINIRFKSIDVSTKEIDSNLINNRRQSIQTTELPTEKSPRTLLSPMSSYLNPPQTVVSSSSFYSNTDIIDIEKCWKFGNIINARFEISLIASNSHEIICYNNQHNYLHFLLISGAYQGYVPWHYNPIIDILWCSLIDRYIALTHNSLYTIEYNRSNPSVANPLIVNKVVDLTKFHTGRLACNQNNILVYLTYQQTSLIEIYDKHFNLTKTYNCSINNSQSFCCTNTYIALTEKDDVRISNFPYIKSKKLSLLLYDINTFELEHTIDLNNCSNIYTMKCLEQENIFFALSDEKILWIIQIDNNQTIQIAKKSFYTNQNEMCIVNNRDLLLINVNAGHAIQLIKYRKIKQ